MKQILPFLAFAFVFASATNTKENMEVWMMEKMKFWKNPQEDVNDHEVDTYVPKLATLRAKAYAILLLLN